MKMRKQRFMGVALVAIAALVVLLASTGETPEDQDATAALLVGPLGLYMIFTKSYILYDGEPEAKARDEPKPGDRALITTPNTTEGVRTWQEKESSSPRVSGRGRTRTTPSGRLRRRNSPSWTLRAR